MFPKLTRRPATLPALLFSSLLLVSAASAQDKKPEPKRPVMDITPVPVPPLPPPSVGPPVVSDRGVGMGVGTGEGVGTGVGPGVGPGRLFNTGALYPLPEDHPDRVFRQAEVTKKAVLTFKAEPEYTEEARKNGVEGVVRLRAVLNVSGQVTSISVIRPLPDGLTEKAISAARQIRFQPAQKDGRPVSQYVVIEYNFNIYYDDAEVERRAVIIEKPEPEYTEEARKNGVEGKVVLDVILYKDGTAQPGEVVAGLPHGLTEKAREAARRVKFRPAEQQGRRVNVIRRTEFVFKLP